MVLSVYLGMRYVTGGGVLAFPLNKDANGQREVIRGHSFRAREGVQYDVNAVWPLLSGVKPNDPNLAPPFVDPREVLEGEPQVEEGVLDDMPAVPAPSRRGQCASKKLKRHQQHGTQKKKPWMLI